MQAGKDTLILAFDTSGPYVAAALSRGDRIVDSVSDPMDRGQAERLVDLLTELLARNGLTFPDLAAVACGTGPGNSTGVRIAVAAARGLALACGIPALGVTRFEAEALDLPQPTLVALDARRGETFVQRFGDNPFGPSLLSTGAPLPVSGCVSVTGDSPQLSGLNAPVPLPAHDPATLAGNIAKIASTRLGKPHPRPAPLYLRAADAAPPRDVPPVLLP